MSALYQSWRQVQVLTWASLKARYRKTWAGLIWVVASPILTYSIQAFVFKNFLKLEVPNYSLFLLGSLLPWIFLVSTIEMSTPLFLNQADLLKGFQLNPLTLLFSQVLDNFLNFLIAFLFLLIPLSLVQEQIPQGIVALPLAVLVLLVAVSALASLFSLFQVFWRDIRYITPFCTNVLFFLTPIFYPLSFVPEPYQVFVRLNPIYLLISPFRLCVYDFELKLFINALAAAALVTTALVFTSIIAWRRKIHEFYLHL